MKKGAGNKTGLIIGGIIALFLVVAGSLTWILIEMINSEDEEPRGSESGYVDGVDLSEVYQKNPILKELPIEVDYFSNNYADRTKYTISYKMSEDLSSFKLLITDYSGGNYEKAISLIREKGFVPEDYEIVYIEDRQESGKAF